PAEIADHATHGTVVGDGVGDACDNCPSVVNPDQADGLVFGEPASLHNGKGDLCEDVDDDGVFDGSDNCLGVANADQVDTDLFPAPASLVSAWNFEDTSGSVAHDSLGHHDLGYENTVQNVVGEVGNAVGFNASGGRLDAGNVMAEFDQNTWALSA